MSVKSQCESYSSSKSRKGASSKMPDDILDEELDEKGVIKRKSRNLSEKKRRDQFNILINELCSMVCTGKRKMDKSTILKSAISFIRNHNQVTMQSHCQETVQEDWKPSFLSNEEFTHLMLEALDEFIIVFSVTGKIFYVSENITCLLGHTPNDLIGTNLIDLVWEDERLLVESLLSSWGSAMDDMNNKDNHVSMCCHLRRGNISSGDSSRSNYELVIFSGYYRFQGSHESSRVQSSWGEEGKDSNSYGDSLSHYNGMFIIASCRLQTPQLFVEMSIVDVSKSEFTSRHSLEWKFLFLDHRGPPIIGYLPFEVLGTSGYDYYHVDDLEKVSACHEALMQKGEVTSCCYRFLTKGQQWIWLQTKYYITYHQWYSKPEFIVCSHRVISYSEVSGHTLKTERLDTDFLDPCEPVPTKVKPDAKAPSHNLNKVNKLLMSDPLQEDSSQNKSCSMNSQSIRERSKSKYLPQQTFSSKSASSINDSEQSTSPGRERSSLRPPPVPTTEPTSYSRLQPRHPSTSSRMTVHSDAGSVSSSGSFQSATSMQSDQSMHSMHGQTSMQSLPNQQTHQSSSSRSNNLNTSAHNSVNTIHPNQAKPSTHMNFVNPHSSSTTNNPQLRNIAHHIHNIPGGTPVRRAFSNSNPTIATVTAPNASQTTTSSFAYQPVLPIGVEGSGVTLPVQRIIEGLPVVTLPGIVAHEPIIMTAAQREFHERLRIKHMEIQKSIMAQQEELRRVETELLLAQYGAWGPTVLKMAVPYSEGDASNTAVSQPAVLSSSGLVTCLADNSLALGQTTSTSVGNAGSGAPVTFSPGTPILVQSPQEIHARSPDRDFMSHEIQILLAQSLLQDNSPSIEYIP